MVDWMDQFKKLCWCAHRAQGDEDCRDSVGAMRKVNLDQLLRVKLRLMEMLTARLALDRDKIEQRKQGRHHGKAGGEEGSHTRRNKADRWRGDIRPEVHRMIKAGKTDINIGALLAAKAGRDAETVAAFAATVRAELGQVKSRK
jgi:hypothetical protein